MLRWVRRPAARRRRRGGAWRPRARARRVQRSARRRAWPAGCARRVHEGGGPRLATPTWQNHMNDITMRPERREEEGKGRREEGKLLLNDLFRERRCCSFWPLPQRRHNFSVLNLSLSVPLSISLLSVADDDVRPAALPSFILSFLLLFSFLPPPFFFSFYSCCLCCLFHTGVVELGGIIHLTRLSGACCFAGPRTPPPWVAVPRAATATARTSPTRRAASTAVSRMPRSASTVNNK